MSLYELSLSKTLDESDKSHVKSWKSLTCVMANPIHILKEALHESEMSLT